MVKFYSNPAAMNTHRGCKNNEIFDSLANLDSCLWRIRCFLQHPPQLPHLLLKQTQPLRALLPDLVLLVGREQDRQSHLLGDVGGIETLYLEVEELVNGKDNRTLRIPLMMDGKSNRVYSFDILDGFECNFHIVAKTHFQRT